MNEDWSKQLKFIRLCRKKNRKNVWAIASVMLVAQFLAIIPVLIVLSAPILVFGFVFMFVSMTKTAHVKCPKCNHGFGSDWKIAIGYGTDNCQHCDLSLYSDREESDECLDH